MTSRIIGISALLVGLTTGWTSAGEPCSSCQGSGSQRGWFKRKSEDGEKKKRFRWLGLSCFGNFDDYSCGSLASEYHFVFGSCRKFFREKCLATQPVDPIIVYRYNQRLYPISGDHTTPEATQIPIFGNTPDSVAQFPRQLQTLPQAIHEKKEMKKLERDY